MIHDPRAAADGPVTKYDQLAPELKKIVDQVKLDPQQRLNPSQLARARDLLAEFADIFAEGPNNPKHTHVMEVALPVTVPVPAPVPEPVPVPVPVVMVVRWWW